MAPLLHGSPGFIKSHTETFEVSVSVLSNHSLLYKGGMSDGTDQTEGWVVCAVSRS